MSAIARAGAVQLQAGLNATNKRKVTTKQRWVGRTEMGNCRWADTSWRAQDELLAMAISYDAQPYVAAGDDRMRTYATAY